MPLKTLIDHRFILLSCLEVVVATPAHATTISNYTSSGIDFDAG